MTRPDQRLADAFVSLAETLRDDYDIPALLTTLADCSVEVLGVGAASVILDEKSGAPVSGASDPEVAQLETEASAWREGPGYDCRRTGAPVAEAVLDGPIPRQRWRRYVPRAHTLGYTRVAAVPLRTRESPVGALVLYRDGPEPLDPAALILGQSLADAAAITLLRERELNESRTLSAQLEQALSSRVVIEQAKGIVSTRMALTMDESFAVLRRYARNHQLLLSTLAQDVVEGRARIGEPGK
ncbi:ANTAR domain-containing protein [Nocardia sp. NBC_01388]|uniref:ANTAR domain-containing protein n=1 Tax=Nocardia sp. NBC_01388 TaxID=2903596 RepID=UPI00325572F5